MPQGGGVNARTGTWGWRRLGLLALAVVLLGVLVSSITRWGPFAEPVLEFRGSLVVIDPGHGGKDPGAVGRSGVREKEVTLAIAGYLEPLLNRAGIYTQLTRRDDVDLADPDAYPRKAQDLRRRVELANAVGADVFVSLHANSFPSRVWRGAQTFYYPDDEAGKRLAERVQAALRRELPPNARQPRPGNYRVLRDTEMAGIVVEVGFLSHPVEEELLTDPQYQQRLAEAIYTGILSFLMGRKP